MQQRCHRRTIDRNGVVIGHDHVHLQLLGTFERLSCGNAVVNGDQKANSLGMQTIDHGRVESIALVHARGNRRLRASSERFEGS